MSMGEVMVKIRSRLFFGLLVLLVLGGGQARAAAPLTICLGGAPGVPIVVAQEQGLFASEGVAVELKKYRTGSEGFEAFFKGECELAAVSETSVVMKSFERQDFRLLATIATSDNSPRILANRKSGIAAPQELRGKRIFVLKWSSNHFFLDLFLAKNGLSEKEVTVVLNGVPDVAAALGKGEIDAFCATEVLIDKPLKALGEEAVVFAAPGLCLVSFHLAAKNSLIASQPEALQKILAALLKNEERMKQEPRAAIKTAAAALEIEEEAMGGIWNNYRWRVELAQTMLLSLEQEALWAMESGFTSKSHVPNYLEFIHQEPLRGLKPEAVSIWK